MLIMNYKKIISLTVLILSMSATALAKSWIDMTSQLLRNPGFEGNDQTGWTWESNAGSQTARCDCMEFWNGTFNIRQTVKDLPKGRYRLSVQTYYRVGDNWWAYDAHRNGTENITAYMYAGKASQKLVSIYSEPLTRDVGNCYENGGKYFPNAMESARIFFDEGKYWNTMEFEAEGTVDIGLRCSEAEGSNWCIFDNFKLEFYGDVVSVSSIEVTGDKTELIVGETARYQAKVLPADATRPWVVWTTDNEAVATVDQDGVVRAVGEGTVSVVATATDDSGTKGSLTLTVVRRQATASSLVINEVMASNVDEFISPAFNFDGWIELYNPTNLAVSLEGLTISDTANEQGPWRMSADMGIIPAGGFRVIWFDSHDIAPQNVPFKLDTDGGTIVIADESGTVIAEQSYPASKERVSYARRQDGSGDWGLTAQATPGASNVGVAFASEQLAAPEVNVPSKLFTGSLSVSVTIPAGCTLRYTTDGTLPTLTNGQTSSNGNFTVTKSSSYRFRLFADGKLPSRVTTRSYIKRDKNYTLPVISVVTDPDFLYSTEIGVMEKGPNGKPGNGQDDKCNWNMDWERPVNFSYLTADGNMAFNQDVNLEMCGGWSRAWTPHSFKLKGNKELGGNKNLDYPFFSQKPYIRNRTLQIRNGGNDTQCRFKDPALQYMMMSSGIDIDCQSYQPVHEFINGNYVGVLNMREPNNKHFVYANYGWDDEVIDLFEMSPVYGYVQMCGTPDAFDELVDVLAADAANSDTYAEICRRLDIDAYANYMAAQMYLGGTDFPQNNVKGFRYRDGGKFRFVMFDLDFAFNANDQGGAFTAFFNKENYLFDPISPSSSVPRLRDRIRFVTLFKNMLQNADFRRQFIDAYCLMGGSVFEKTRATQIVNELLNRVEPAMNLETVWNWWGESKGSAANTANDVKNNLNNRLSRAISDLRKDGRMQLSTVAQRVILKSDTEGASLFINGQKVPTGKFDGQLFAPVTLRAQAPAGYVFLNWVSNSGTVYNDAEMPLPSGSVNLTAHFKALTADERLANGIMPVRINEVSGANDSYISDYAKKDDWVELYNTTDEPVDVEGMYLTDNLNKMEKYQITKGSTKANTVIPAHGYLIVWCDKRETTDKGLHASFKISDDGGSVALTAADKSWTDIIDYSAHDATTTVGRFPDGTADVYKMNVPTIAASNVKTSYMTAVSQTNGSTDIRTVSKDADSELRLCYGSGLLVLSSDTARRATVSIYTPGGQLVEEGTVSLTGSGAHYDVSHLPSGFYVAHASGENGSHANCKFMK